MQETGISPTLFWGILTAMAVAISAMAGYIVRLHRENRQANEERAKVYQEWIKMIAEMMKETER